MRKTNGLAFWTLTMWQSPKAMSAFLLASPHKEAMQKLPYWCDEAAFGPAARHAASWRCNHVGRADPVR